MKKRINLLLGASLLILASCSNEVKTTKETTTTIEATSIETTSETTTDIKTTTETIEEFITLDKIIEKYYQNNRIEFIEFWEQGFVSSAPYIFEDASNDEVLNIFRNYTMKKTTFDKIFSTRLFHIAPIFENYKWNEEGEFMYTLRVGMSCLSNGCVAYFYIPTENESIIYSIEITEELYNNTYSYFKNLPKVPFEKWHELYE